MTKEEEAKLEKKREQMLKEEMAIAATQDTYVSKRWGKTVFHEAPKGWGEKKVCSRCILREDKEDCDRARCSPGFRTDGKDGYFTVRNTPEPPEK
ncbi:MAG: hypothetical protein K5885_02435 [Bacteroidales bacterium]|nr:hypothetical protein [Bacteroidales bacterium]